MAQLVIKLIHKKYLDKYLLYYAFNHGKSSKA